MPALICLHCKLRTTDVIWSEASGSLIHKTISGHPHRSICGGHVIYEKEPWTEHLRPGRVFACYPASTGSLTAHKVKLGRIVGLRACSWSGDSNCGWQPKSELWLPIAPEIAAHVQMCRDCDRTGDTP